MRLTVGNSVGPVGGSQICGSPLGPTAAMCSLLSVRMSGLWCKELGGEAIENSLDTDLDILNQRGNALFSKEAIRGLEPEQVAVKIGRAILGDLRAHPMDLSPRPKELPKLQGSQKVSKTPVAGDPQLGS